MSPEALTLPFPLDCDSHYISTAYGLPSLHFTPFSLRLYEEAITRIPHYISLLMSTINCSYIPASGWSLIILWECSIFDFLRCFAGFNFISFTNASSRQTNQCASFKAKGDEKSEERRMAVSRPVQRGCFCLLSKIVLSLISSFFTRRRHIWSS